MLPFCRHISISMSQDLSVSPETSSRILSHILWFNKCLEVRGSAICFAKFISIYYLYIYVSLYIYFYILSLYINLFVSLCLYIYTRPRINIKMLYHEKKGAKWAKKPALGGFFSKFAGRFSTLRDCFRIVQGAFRSESITYLEIYLVHN